MSRRRAPSASVTTLEAPRRSPHEGASKVPPTPNDVPATSRPVRRGLRWVLVAAVVAATVVVAGRWIVRLPYLSVQHVEVVGVHHEPLSAVLAASGLDAHPPMIDVSSSSVQDRLGHFAWISGVSVVKHWPNTVVLDVRETSAVAVAFDAHHHLRFVNARGRDLGPAPLDANLATLEVTGYRSAWPYDHAAVAAAVVAAQLPAAFARQVSVITVNRSGAVTLHMTTPVSFVLGPPTQLRAKFVAIASVIAHSTLRPGDVVNVTVPDELSVTGGAPT